jgi:hypothetical protein
MDLAPASEKGEATSSGEPGNELTTKDGRGGKETMATAIKKLDKTWLGDVPADKVFWCHDGKTLKNMGELASALKQMSDETFEHHLNSERNDFSTWVREVIGDITLAGQLARVATRATAARKVEARMSSIQASR